MTEARRLAWTDSPEAARREACIVAIPGVEGAGVLLSYWQTPATATPPRMDYWVQLKPSCDVPSKWVRFYTEPAMVGAIVDAYFKDLAEEFEIPTDGLSHAEVLGAILLATQAATDGDEGAEAL